MLKMLSFAIKEYTSGELIFYAALISRVSNNLYEICMGRGKGGLGQRITNYLVEDKPENSLTIYGGASFPYSMEKYVHTDKEDRSKTLSYGVNNFIESYWESSNDFEYIIESL